MPLKTIAETDVAVADTHVASHVALVGGRASGGGTTTELLAVGTDVRTRGAPGGAVPSPSALDLFQLALALAVGLVFRRLRA